MRPPVVLLEYASSGPVKLSITQRDTLRQLVPGLTVIPAPGSTDAYTLTNDSTVGVVRVGALTVELRPKFGIAPVLFLVSYALDPEGLEARTGRAGARPQPRRGRHPAVRPHHAAGDPARAAPRLSPPRRHPDRRPGPHPDRRPVPRPHRTTPADRGRLRRLHPGHPGESAAPHRRGYSRATLLRHEDSRAALARLRQQLNGISILIPDTRGVPEPDWTRLNERYRPAVALARLIISTAGLEARAGGEDASAFLVDMNDVFERFIRAALREALKLDQRAFPAAASGRRVHLDTGHEIPLQPDLSWWTGGRCVFVGDCKYKKTGGSVPNADVYQMLAYLTALRLPDGLLVYAAGEDRPHAITIPFADKRILVRTVDISQPPADVLAQVARVASLIRSLAAASSEPTAVAS